MGALLDAFLSGRASFFWTGAKPFLDGTSYRGYALANPGEFQTLTAYVRALDAGQTPAPPQLQTIHGKALVGMLAALAGQPTPPPPPPPPPPHVSDPIRRLDFSTGNTSQWLGDETGVGCHVSVVSADASVPHGAKYVGVFSVPGPTSGSDRNRAQVTLDTFDKIGNEGQEEWYTDSFCIAAGSKLAPNVGWNNLVSFHQWVNNGLIAPMHLAFSTDANGVPSLYLTSYGGNWKSTDAGDPPPNWIQYERTFWYPTPLVPGQWYDVMIHPHWSPTNLAGWVEAWVNGKPWIVKTGAANQYTTDKTGITGSRNYLKAGYDTQAGNGPTTVWHANVDVWPDAASAWSVFGGQPT